MGILVSNTLRRIDQQQNDVCRFDCLQCFYHREFFNGFKHFAFAAQTSRIDQLKTLSVPLKRHRNGITGGTRQIKRYQALFAKPSVDQGRFSDIGSARHGEFDYAFYIQNFIIWYFGQLYLGQRCFNQVTNSLAMRR